ERIVSRRLLFVEQAEVRADAVYRSGGPRLDELHHPLHRGVMAIHQRLDDRRRDGSRGAKDVEGLGAAGRQRFLAQDEPGITFEPSGMISSSPSSSACGQSVMKPNPGSADSVASRCSEPSWSSTSTPTSAAPWLSLNASTRRWILSTS